jgi:hypothetical protein
MRICLILVSFLVSITAPLLAADLPTLHLCRRASGPIMIDGRANEAAWKSAPVIDQFYTVSAPRRPSLTATRAKLLWDDEYLYFCADMDDADLYAEVTEQDGATWTNDVFELFFRPAADKRAYYEFEVSANNTKLDMFLPSRGSGGYARWKDRPKFGWQTAVALRGTLNEWQDKDNGWSVEGRIPWSDFAATGGRPAVDAEWKFTLTRYDYSVDFESPELSACAPLSRPDFHRYEDYATLRFVSGD